jgi:hypothetical protein
MRSAPLNQIHNSLSHIRFNDLVPILEGEKTMKKLLFGIILLALVSVAPIPTMAQVRVNVNIGLPPPIVFAAPPELIVIPDTYVYVAPDIDVDLFFWNGWWWRLWEGRWYRSRYYNRGWGYYTNVPTFYFDVDPGWREYYRDRNWYGHRWDYERIPNQRLQQNWSSWQNSQRWERQGTWGVQNYQPRPQQQRQELRQQRQQQYQQGPQVQPQVQQPRRQLQERVQPQVQQPTQQLQERVQPEVQQQPQRSRPQDKSEGRREEHVK